MKYLSIIFFVVGFSFSGYCQEATSSKKITNEKQSVETVEKQSVKQNENSSTAISNKKILVDLPINTNNTDTVNTSGQLESAKRIPKD